MAPVREAARRPEPAPFRPCRWSNGPRACLVHPSPRCAETARESLRLFQEVGDAPRAALSRVLLAVEGVTGEMRPRTEELSRRGEAGVHP